MLRSEDMFETLQKGPARPEKLPISTPRGKAFSKSAMRRLINNVDGLKLSKYCRQVGIKPSPASLAIQYYFPEWWMSYKTKHRSDIKICGFCRNEFVPYSKLQMYCLPKCSRDAKRDREYFGNKRINTIGLSDGECQLCGQSIKKGLSSHHVIGKKNDDDNKYLIALCRGCHEIVSLLSNRKFVYESEVWETLILLTLFRKEGKLSTVKAAVDISAQ